MLLLGLTGSIATGKSTVSNLLRSPPYNLPIIDADILARKVVEPGTAGYNAIVSYFAASTPDLLLTPTDLDPRNNKPCGENGFDGKGRPLNRPALGRRVFGGDAERQEARKKLNGIVHPAVRREMWKLMAYYYLTGHWAIVLDIPLLFESGWETMCGTVLVVAVHDPAVQMRRLRERDAHLSEEDAKNRVLSQGDVREKAARALARGDGRGVVVWNDGDMEHLRREVDRVLQKTRSTSPAWWSWFLLLCPPAGVAAATWNYVRCAALQRQWAEEKRKEKARL